MFFYRSSVLAAWVIAQVHKNVHITPQMSVKFQTFQQARKNAVNQNWRDFEHGGSRYVNKQGSPFYSPADGSSYGRPSGRIDIDIEHAREDALARGRESFTHRGTEYNRRGGMSDVYDPDVFQLESDDDTFEDARQQPQRHQQHREHPHHPHPVIQLSDDEDTETDEEMARPLVHHQHHQKPKKKRIAPTRIQGQAPAGLFGQQRPKKKAKRITPVRVQGADAEGAGNLELTQTEQEEARKQLKSMQARRMGGMQSFADRYVSKADQVRLEATLLYEHLQVLLRRLSKELKAAILKLEPEEEDENGELQVDPSSVIDVADDVAAWLNAEDEARNQPEVDRLDRWIQHISELDEAAEQMDQQMQGQGQPQQEGILLSQLGQLGEDQQEPPMSDDDSQQLSGDIDILSPGQPLNPPPAAAWPPPPPPPAAARSPPQPPQPPPPAAAWGSPQPFVAAPAGAGPRIQQQFLTAYTTDRRGALKRLVQSHNKRAVADMAASLGVTTAAVKKQLRRERGRLANLGVKHDALASLTPADVQSLDPRISAQALLSLMNDRLVTTTWPAGKAQQGAKSKGAVTVPYGLLLDAYAARTGIHRDNLSDIVAQQQTRRGK
jgi:hypothetical protein